MISLFRSDHDDAAILFERDYLLRQIRDQADAESLLRTRATHLVAALGDGAPEVRLKRVTTG